MIQNAIAKSPDSLSTIKQESIIINIEIPFVQKHGHEEETLKRVPVCPKTRTRGGNYEFFIYQKTAYTGRYPK